MSTLLALPLHQSATVLDLATPVELTRRLAAMGLRRGCQVTVLRRASWRGPLQIRVDSHTELMLRRIHAAFITVSAEVAA